jgi:hypothetical protein
MAMQCNAVGRVYEYAKERTKTNFIQNDHLPEGISLHFNPELHFAYLTFFYYGAHVI